MSVKERYEQAVDRRFELLKARDPKKPEHLLKIEAVRQLAEDAPGVVNGYVLEEGSRRYEAEQLSRIGLTAGASDAAACQPHRFELAVQAQLARLRGLRRGQPEHLIRAEAVRLAGQADPAAHEEFVRERGERIANARDNAGPRRRVDF